MTAEAKGVKKIAVNFNKTVDTTTTKLVVKKGAATPTIASTTFAADAKSAEIALGTKLTAGVYTVEATVGEEKLTANITTQDEKLTSFKLVSPNLVATPKVTTIATISYMALNQYDEMMVADVPTVSCTFGTTTDQTKGGKVTAPSADKSGKITVGDINPSLAIPGTTGTIVIVDKSTGVNLNTSVTYQSKAVASSATVYGIYNKKTEKLIEGNLTTGAKAADYAVLMSVKDQYDGYMSPDDIKKSEVDVSFNPASVLTDLKIDSTNNKVSGSESELTYEGASAFLLPLKTDIKGGKLSAAGTLSLTIVSGQKGVIASPTFTVDEAKVIKTLSVAPASTVYAGEDNALTVEAYDAAGNAITKHDDLQAAGLTYRSSNGSFELRKNADGTGTLYFKPDSFSSDDKNVKESNIATLIFTANSATSTDYLVKTTNVTYYEARKPWAVSGKTDKTVNACANKKNTTLSLDLTTLSYEDQYSNVIKAGTDKKATEAATSDVQIWLLDKKGVFGKETNDQGRALEATEKSGNNIVLTTRTDGNGDATLFFRYMNATKQRTLSADDSGNVSVDKYDFKMTVSATSVSDFVASDLKVVVNKGNAVFASSEVTLKPVDTTDPYNNDAADKNAKHADEAAVYVTGVVKGNTVVLPTTQFHLVTKKIDALGAYDAKNNDKTETKKVTVVVDSESGAQELTADVGNSVAAKQITKEDLIKAVKVLDQYGNAMMDKAGDFRYEVTFTGNNTSLEPKITGEKTQEIKIDFDGKIQKATIVTATVKYTTMDGKITFTQDVTVNVTI